MFEEPQTEPLDLTMSKMCGGRIEPPDASIVEASGRQADHEDARSLNIPIQEASREQTAVGDMPKKIWLMRKHSQNATQTGKKRLKCEISKKDFVAPPSTHTMNHANEKPFPCSECNMSFIWPSHLNRYDDSYREKPHSCSECGKNFTLSCTLSQHMKIHTNEKPFSCLECNMSFIGPSHLNRHMKIHIVRSHILVRNVGRISPSHRICVYISKFISVRSALA
ncbi:zinc finger protein [Loa loa]|uniref:Zinc finger protein n=1 Tax=Loa loa TaxID=7209 RepID=A0A1S0UG46_LOALO|nr:zinc finger protein [Loa loa]EJD73837.1 zinc finger protein [Loa loa]